MKSQLVECVPNFSEGRDLEKVEKIIDCFRGKEGVKLLDYSSDKDHNRSVVTLVGAPEAVKKAVVNAMGVAKELIDLTKHEGQHPRMGATDVVPFIPISNIEMDECVALAKEVAELAYKEHGIPSFLYEAAASGPHRSNLSKLRKGQFEGMAEKVKDPHWAPDFGETVHETAGITAIGAREFLVAYNVILGTNNLDIAKKIGKMVRNSGGGFSKVKAMGIAMEERNLVQVSMNLTDYKVTPLYQVFEYIKMEAKRYGVPVVGSELIGLAPMAALISSAEYYLGIEDFSMDQVLEKRMLE